MAELPQTVGEKLKYSLPVIILTLVLALGFGYLITALVDGKTREALEQFQKAQAAENEKLGKKIADTEASLKKDLADQGEKFEAANKKLGDQLAAIGKNFETFADDMKKFQQGTEQLDKVQTQDIATTNQNVGALERRVKYIDEKLEKLAILEKDVNALKGDTSTLKEQYVTLRSDLTTVKTKADVTDKELTDLGERTRLFQLRVLAARAREAADAARSADLKTLLQRLEDVGGEK